MSMMRARVRGHRWVDHPVAAVMKARVPGQWVDCPAAVVMEAREQGRCWIDHPAVAVMEARVQGRHWVDRPSVGKTGGVHRYLGTLRGLCCPGLDLRNEQQTGHRNSPSRCMRPNCVTVHAGGSWRSFFSEQSSKMCRGQPHRHVQLA
ncbi:hypothetical protein ACOMHN_030072 [Nucella lapillus]